MLERLALAHAARETLGYTGPLAGSARFPPCAASTVAAACRGGAGVPGVPARATPRLVAGRAAPPHAEEWESLVREVEAFAYVERRRVFHLAYEPRFREQTLDALALHARRK